MENRLFLAFVVSFLGIFVHEVFTQKLDATIPCIDTIPTSCSDSRLPANARCVSGVCICTAENGESKNCTTQDIQKKPQDRNPAAAHPCKHNQECGLNYGFCNTTRSLCECNEGYVMASQSWRCLPISRSLGAACEDNQQCQHMGNNTSCVEKQCVCSDDHHFSDNACWKRLGFGEECKDDHECSHNQNTLCIRGPTKSLCGCSETSVLSSSGEQCIPITMKMMQTCTERVQCMKKFIDSDCINQICQCKDNHHFEASISQCVISRSLRENCTTDTECFQEHEEKDMGRPQVCTNNICTCNELFRPEADKCVAAGASSLVSGLFLSILSSILLFTRS